MSERRIVRLFQVQGIPSSLKWGKGSGGREGGVLWPSATVTSEPASQLSLTSLNFPDALMTGYDERTDNDGKAIWLSLKPWI